MSLGPAYDTKEQVRLSVDIVDLVGSYLTLRRQGRNFVGLCPWHDDTRPSLQVNSERQSWKCWVCDIGGDVFSFVMQREGVDFREALQILADRSGIELAPLRGSTASLDGTQDKQILYRAAAWAEQQFHDHLRHRPEAQTARQYLDERGITPESIERFRVGFAPDNWQWLVDRARSTEFSPQLLQAVGLLGQSEKSGRYYDLFRGRIVFPIRDTQRRVIAFGGRLLPQLAEDLEAGGRTPVKYFNSPETRLYCKSDQLYALDIAISTTSKDPQRRIIVVEGYTDVIMAHQCGLTNVVAVCGTALGQRHIGVLRRFADQVTLVLDGDEAGQRRTNQILELFVAADLDLRILTLPQGQDPFDFLRNHGVEPFQQLIAGAADALGHKLEIEIRGVDLADDTHRASQALENVLSTIAKAPRMQVGSANSSRLREQQILSRLARLFRIDEVELRARLNELRRKSRFPIKATGTTLESGVEPSSLDPKEGELIEILLLHPALTTMAVENISSDQLATGPTRAIYETICKLHHAGEPTEFNRVMTELENARQKNLLVVFDERAREKADHTEQDAPSRLYSLIAAFANKEKESRQRERLVALEQRTLDEQEELNVLQQLIESERSRQGISVPTDG